MSYFVEKGRQENKKAIDYIGNDNKVDERRKWKTVNNEDGRQNCLKALRNELKISTDKTN